MNTVIVPRASWFAEACEAIRFFGKDVKWVAKGSFSSIGHRWVVEDLSGRFFSIFWFDTAEIGGESWRIGNPPNSLRIEELHGLRELGNNLDREVVETPGYRDFAGWE